MSLFSNKLFRYSAPILFFFFICWIIYDADRGDYNIFIDLGRSLPHSDKLFHALLYGVMAFLTNMALGLKQIKVFGKQYLLGSVVVLSFAIIEEITQISFETRDFDILDVISDIIGVLIFSYLSTYYFKSMLKKEASK